ncbi:cytochrome P450 81Q32-like [Salvia divinorum]|uniref:(+)-piperitol/(+)-sesamin synthase n=1 Tax=Salvia divinorum TaxID=28513 RepID=A0ABD1I750_SALDI
MEATLLYILFSLSFILITLKFYYSRKKLPPTPFPSLPLLGHLHLLKFPLHRTFLNLSRKLGPVFSLRLGTRVMVVVSSPAAAEECFTKNDIILANRPRFIIGKYIGYNYTSLVGAPYGDYWRSLRRLTATEIFSSARLNSFQSIRHDEVRLMLENLSRKSGHASVEIRQLLSELTFNNIMRMVAGKRYFSVGEDDEEAEEFRGIIKEVFSYGGVSNLADFFPVLRWFDYKGVEKNLAKISAKMDATLQALIDEQRRHSDGNTMINHLLALQNSDPEYYTEEIIKCLIVTMLLVGTDTSSVTVEWAMSALLNNPEKMKKARKEIDRVVGNDRLLQESDLHNLSYLQNIISETLRLFPAAPLLVPHEASSDCKIAGYDVPRGAIVMVNAWAIQRDPSVWDDPETFKPERFQGEGIGAPNLLAFGMGRRACPGSGLAHRVVGLALGCLIQCFEWERVDERLVDLSEGKGASMPKNVPLEAKCKVSDVGRRVISV